MSWKIRVPLHHAPGCLQTVRESIEVVDEDAGMSLASGGETFLDSKMDFPPSSSEPAPAPGGQYGRLVHLDHLQDAAVEAASGVLAARWNSQLDVMESLERE